MKRIAALILLLASFIPVFAAETETKAAFEPITPKLTESLDHATKWILKAQNADGSWGVDYRTPADVSATACAALSLLSAGNTGRDGPSPECVKAVKKAVEYILKRVRQMHPGADISEGETSDIQTYVGQRVHSVFALIFLSQVYGSGPDQGEEDRNQIKEAIIKLADTVSSAQESDGSWYKDTYSSLQATAWAWQSLRSANACGIPVKHATIERTLKFIHSAFDSSSNMFNTNRYGQGGNPIYATAAGIRIINGMGLWNSREYTKVTETLLNHVTKPPGDQAFLTNTGEDFMASVLLTHGIIKEEGPHWEQWFTFVRNRLQKIQNADGSWTATSCLAGRTFPTAFAMLCLETPYRLLPIQDL